MLEGTKIKLRALEPTDLDFLFDTENDIDLWEVSSTKKPFSKFVLKRYLENSHLDIYLAKQVRFIIEDLKTFAIIGSIDLFDYNPEHHRAGLGIYIHPNYQQKGYAFESIKLLLKYTSKVLKLHQVYANITTDNKASLNLFEKVGFELIGVKKDWVHTIEGYKDQALYQYI